MMTRLGWHRSNRNLRNLYPVRDYSHSRIIHGGVCVNAIDKPLEWDVGFFFGNTDLSLELRSLYTLITACQDDSYHYVDTYCGILGNTVTVDPHWLVSIEDYLGTVELSSRQEWLFGPNGQGSHLLQCGSADPVEGICVGLSGKRRRKLRQDGT